MASLTPFSGVLGRKNARHLLRRSSFVYTKDLISQFENLTPQQALDLLSVNPELTLPLPYDPEPVSAPHGYWTESSNSYNFQGRKESILAGWFWYNAIKSPTLKYKLSYFLSTRFVIEKSNGAGNTKFVYDHIRLLMYYAYGSYKTLAKKMTLDNSMLLYLDNHYNRKTAPNENYGREFLELFTIGKGVQIAEGNYTNYTEIDVVQAARVFTGFRFKNDRLTIDPETNIPCGIKYFPYHYRGAKTFSNAFNNSVINGASNEATMQNELNDFTDMVFNQMATARHLASKLYQYFVKTTITDEVENDIIEPLANQLMNTNYEILPVVRTLLESQHFYDVDDENANDETIGGMVKSPLQQVSEMITYLYANLPDPQTQPLDFYKNFWTKFLHDIYFSKSNQIPFNPDTVAGHTAYYQKPYLDKLWINSSTLIARKKIGESLLEGTNKIQGNSNIYARINIADVLKNNNLVTNPANAYSLCSELMADLFAQEPEPIRITYFKDTYLLQNMTDSQWSNAWSDFIQSGNANVVLPRLKSLLKNILKAPESQLF